MNNHVHTANTSAAKVDARASRFKYENTKIGIASKNPMSQTASAKPPIHVRAPSVRRLISSLGMLRSTGTSITSMEASRPGSASDCRPLKSTTSCHNARINAGKPTAQGKRRVSHRQPAAVTTPATVTAKNKRESQNEGFGFEWTCRSLMFFSRPGAAPDGVNNARQREQEEQDNQGPSYPCSAV